MRKLFAGLATGIFLAAAATVPTAPAAAAVQESIKITTTRAVSYGDAFRHNESDPWATYAFRPRMGVTTKVLCDAGRKAVVYYGPVTAHQGPQAGPFTCTGKSQNVTVFAAAGEVGPVRVHAELRYLKNHAVGPVLARHQRTVRATDVQAFAGTVTAPSPVKKGEPVELKGQVQHLTQGSWRPLGTTLEVRFQDENGKSRIVGTTTSTKKGKVSYTTPAVTRSGSWYLVLNRGGRDWWVTGTRVQVTAPKPAPSPAPSIWIGRTTSTTADVHWTAPAGVKDITGYRFGWTSSNGKPVPAWQGDWPANRTSPLTMTNLHPGTTYTMWVAVLTPQGEGRRASFVVTTLP